MPAEPVWLMTIATLAGKRYAIPFGDAGRGSPIVVAFFLASEVPQ